MHLKRAFTLIELLVVIAIIAILAAILFPVFAQAKFSAKKAASLSNIKQVALASIMYGNDYDDNIPIFVNGPYAQIASYAGGAEVDTWVYEVQPYIKSLKLMDNPETSDTYSIFGSGTNAWWRNQDLFPYYGINYLFLSPWNGTCSGAAGSKSFSGASQPSNTVFFTETRAGSPTYSSGLGYFTATAPGMYPVIVPSPNYCIWSGAGWTKTNPANKTLPNTAEVALFDGSGTNVSWLDGHSKYQKADALAAGTNYATSTSVNSTVITDITKYVWSYDGTIPQ